MEMGKHVFLGSNILLYMTFVRIVTHISVLARKLENDGYIYVTRELWNIYLWDI